VIWRVLIGLTIAVAVAWLALIAVLLVARPKGGVAREALRLLPDTLRLLRCLATEPATPRRSRVLLWLTIAYLASPIDLVPDFVPVLGYADDAIIVGIVLRSVVRRAGPDRVRRCWPGTAAGLRGVWQLAGLPGDPLDGSAAVPPA
jgi:uncharacterized membrane protein YkvA (DUF1232 family)